MGKPIKNKITSMICNKLSNRRVLEISKTLLLVGLILVSQEVIAQDKKSSIAAAKYKDIVVSLTKTHLPSVYQRVVNESYCGPDRYKSYVGRGKNLRYVPWNMEVNEKVVYKKMGTIIHESVHVFQSGPSRHTVYRDNNKDGEFLRFTGKVLISDNWEINYEGRDVIRSYQMVPEILEENPNIADLFRFDTYIGGGENGNTASNISGIYGLMEEFSAYYHGSNASFIIYNDLKKKNIMQYYDWDKDDGSTYDTLILENIKLTREQANYCMSSYTSYYEFSVFIGAYLKYVKKHHPTMYHEILSNERFRTAFRVIDQNFSRLAIRMEKEFGDEYQAELSSWKIRTGVKNRELAKKILLDYTAILDEFRSTNSLTTKK